MYAILYINPTIPPAITAAITANAIINTSHISFSIQLPPQNINIIIPNTNKEINTP